MQTIISHFIFPESADALESVALVVLWLKLQIWMQAGKGRLTRTPISGEWEADGNGATARYCLRETVTKM